MIFLAAWFHNLSPFAIEFSPGFGVRWYGLSYAMGFLIGYVILRGLARRRLILIPPERVGDAILVVVAGVIIGGRLGYVLIYQPDLLTTFMRSPPWWGLLDIAHGGMASHGGMVGVILASFLIARGWKDGSGTRQGRTPVLHVFDALALVAPFGFFLGRLANFVNGELLGDILALPGQPAPWWSVKFPQEVLTGQGPSGQKDQVVALLYKLGIDGPTFTVQYNDLLTLIQHGGHNLAVQLEPLISARHPSQLYQACAEGIVLGSVLWAIARRRRVPGVTACWFLICYGVLRILTELYRLPDPQMSRYWGLSMGQWLSVVMVIVGGVALPMLIRRGGPKLGGWAEGARTETVPAT